MNKNENTRNAQQPPAPLAKDSKPEDTATLLPGPGSGDGGDSGPPTRP